MNLAERIFRNDNRTRGRLMALHGVEADDVTVKMYVDAWSSTDFTDLSSEARALASQLGSVPTEPWEDGIISKQAEMLRREGACWPMGFPPSTIPAGDELRIQTQPQVDLLVERLIIPNEICPYLIVSDIRIGMNSLMANSAPVPASAFSHRAFPFVLPREVARISQIVSVFLVNISASMITAYLMIVGRAYYGQCTEDHQDCLEDSVLSRQCASDMRERKYARKKE